MTDRYTMEPATKTEDRGDGSLTVLYVPIEPGEVSVPAALAEKYGIDVRLASTLSEAATRLEVEESGIDCAVVATNGKVDDESGIGEIADRVGDTPVIAYVGPRGGPEGYQGPLQVGADDVVVREADTAGARLLAHRIEQSVSRSRERRRTRRLEAALEQLGRGVLIAESGGRIEYVDRAFEAQSGVRTGLEGCDLRTGQSDVESGSDGRGLFEAVSGGEAWSGALEVPGEDGELSRVDVMARSLRDGEDGQSVLVVTDEALDRTRYGRGLDEGRRNYRDLIDTAPDAIVLADVESGEIVEVNDGAASLFGRPKCELVGMNQADLHPAAERERYRDLFERHREAGEAVFRYLEADEPIHVVTAEGERVPVEINAKVVEIDDRTLIQGHFRDVSERREQERKLQAVLHGLPDIAIVYNEDGEYEEVLTGQDDLLVESPEVLRGADVREALPGETAERILEAVREALATAEPQRLEYRLPVDGDDRWFEARTAPLEADAYDTDSVVFIARDVTDRKERERALRSFREAVEQAGHVVMITDTDGRIEYVNPAFEDVTGYAETEVLGEDPSILKSGEQDEAFYRDMWETISSGNVWRGELTNERKNGERYDIHQTVAPITTEDGEIERYVAINTDITDRKQYEHQLEKERDRLEDFARTVAHDLRNPLTIALGHAEIAQYRQPDERVSDPLETAIAALERMGTVIDEVLTLSEQGETIHEPERVALTDVVTTAWDHVDTASASLSIGDDVSGHTVRADGSRLRTLLENLFRNAVEHGGPDVTVRAGTLATGGGFFIEDDGPGFPETDSSRIFDSGFTTSDEGTGFGLAIVRQVVDAHGWSIVATDSEGTEGGARFEITGVEHVER